MRASVRRPRQSGMPTQPTTLAQPAAGSVRIRSFGLIAALAVVAYWNSFEVPFHFDDEAGIVNNDAIRDLGRLDRVLIATTQFRPVTMLTYALNYWWGELNPFGYHVVNLALHILAAVMVYLIVESLAGRPGGPGDGMSSSARIALWSALLFVSHPVNTEAVTYLWGRSEALYAILSLVALYCFIRARILYEQRQIKPNRRRTRTELMYNLGALAAFILALGSKEVAISVPLLMVLVESCFIAPGGIRAWRRRLRSVAPYVVLSIVRVVLEFTLLQQAWDVPPDQRPVFRVMRPAPDGLNIYTNILTQVHALVHYLKLLVFPVTLNFDHDFSVARSPLDPRVWLSLGLWAGLGAAAFRVYGRSRLPLFCLLWFLIALSFYVAYPLPDLLVERRLYLPSVGFCLMVAVIAHRLSMLRIPSLSPRAVKALGVIVPLMIVVGYAAGTIRRNAVWHDPLTVWQDSAQKSPAKARIRCNLAAMFLRRNEPAQAAREAREALRLDPDYGDARYNLLSAYANAGLFSQSVAEFATAWRIQPAVAARWYVENYLNLKTNRGPYDDAVSQFAKIVTGASSGDAHVALAVVYLNVYGDRQKGRMYLEQGRRRQPQSFRLNVVDRMLRDLERDRPAAPVTSG